MDITEEAQATVHRESSEAVSALLASQESTALSPYLPLNPSPAAPRPGSHRLLRLLLLLLSRT